jgi:ribosome-interacting GTPase 1
VLHQLTGHGAVHVYIGPRGDRKLVSPMVILREDSNVTVVAQECESSVTVVLRWCYLDEYRWHDRGRDGQGVGEPQ